MERDNFLTAKEAFDYVLSTGKKVYLCRDEKIAGELFLFLPSHHLSGTAAILLKAKGLTIKPALCLETVENGRKTYDFNVYLLINDIFRKENEFHRDF